MYIAETTSQRGLEKAQHDLIGIFLKIVGLLHLKKQFGTKIEKKNLHNIIFVHT